MIRTSVALVAFSLAFATAAGAQSFSSLEEKMTAKEFSEAGLDKLSPEELERLNAWLRDEALSAPAASYATAPQNSADRIGFRDKPATGVIVSRIDGEFSGWSSNTVFVLENGQVWQQIDNDSRLGGVKIDSPEVTIEPGLFGSWSLQVEGFNRKVKVKRLR